MNTFSFTITSDTESIGELELIRDELDRSIQRVLKKHKLEWFTSGLDMKSMSSFSTFKKVKRNRKGRKVYD